MTKLHELLGKDLVEGAKFGIEIEAEGEGMRKIATQYWNSEDDGSLRGAFPQQRHEFVSTVLPFNEVEAALNQLIESQKGAAFDFSFRTSSHVHVNCLDMEQEAVAAFIYTYFLVEKDLMKYCGEHRNNNRFCLRMVDSDVLVDMAKTLIQMSFRDMRHYVGEDMRYGACNMAALSKYGTLEFRGMRGTLEKEVLLNWVGVLNNLREFAIKEGNAWNVYNIAVQDPKGFHKRVFGQFYNVFFTQDTEWNLTEALSLAIEIPFAAKEMAAKPAPANKNQKRINEYVAAYRKAAAVGDSNLMNLYGDQAAREGINLLAELLKAGDNEVQAAERQRVRLVQVVFDELQP